MTRFYYLRRQRKPLSLTLKDFYNTFVPVASRDIIVSGLSHDELIYVPLRPGTVRSPNEEFLVVIMVEYDNTYKIIYSRWKKPVKTRIKSRTYYITFRKPWLSTIRYYGVPKMESYHLKIIVFRPRRVLSAKEKEKWSMFRR